MNTNDLLINKMDLDRKIKNLINDFAIKNKCGYNGNISVRIIKKNVSNIEVANVGVESEVLTIVTF